ncbi:MAG: tetratricopeptide repeat protein, partial [Paludibacteraceae bacterium]|nr:tetratricopeptide repeat protein [Paludibacteraceae bacterium]
PYIFLMRGEQYLKHGKVELANADFNAVLANDTLVTKGSCRHFALLLLGKHAEALEWMNKMVELDPNDAGAYYDKACLLSRMGKLDESIATLRVSFEKGYRAFAHIEHDDDMDAIRNHPDFISLIEKYKQKPILVP